MDAIAVAAGATGLVLVLSGCAPTEVEDFVYRDAARRVDDLSVYLSEIFEEHHQLVEIENRVHQDASTEGPVARVWDAEGSNAALGGNWVTQFEQSSGDGEVSVNAIVTVPGQPSGGLFSSRSASVFLCVRYEGTLGSSAVRTRDGVCPDGLEEQLKDWLSVSVDQLVEYEIEE